MPWGSRLGALACATALCACSAPAPAPAPTSQKAPVTPVYSEVPRPVRPDEKPIHITGADGDTGYTLIGLTRLPALVGSHAEMRAAGEFLRIRVLVTNKGRSTVRFDTARQLLVLTGGATQRTDSEAMLVKRQPGEFDLGSGVRVEFDLYYDVPPGTRAVALRAHGGPALSDMSDREGTDIPLK